MGTKEFFTTTGENLLKKIKELIEEGNARLPLLKNPEEN
jgi:hypothetical protein